MKVLYLILIILWFYSCNDITGEKKINIFQNIEEQNLLNKQSQEKYKHYKTIRQYILKINNDDTNSIGFRYEPHDESAGISCVVLRDDFAYLTDPVHGNVKRINLLDGITIASKVISNDPRFNIRNIVVFNEQLYIFSDKDTFFILDYDLILQGSFFVENWQGGKEIFSIQENMLVVYRPGEDINQLQDKRMQICIVKISNRNTIERDTVIYNYEDYRTLLLSSIRGVRYNESKEGENYLLETPLGKYLMKEPIPRTSKYYGSINFDFNEKYLVYFNSTPTEFILTVYEY